MTYPDFSRLLNKYLNENERSAAWLSRKLNLNETTVPGWLNNDGRPRDRATVDEIANIFRLNEIERDELREAAGFLYRETFSRATQANETNITNRSISPENQHSRSTNDQKQRVILDLPNSDPEHQSRLVQFIASLRQNGIYDDVVIRYAAWSILLVLLALALISRTNVIQQLGRWLFPKNTPPIIQPFPTPLPAPTSTPTVKELRQSIEDHWKAMGNQEEVQQGLLKLFSLAAGDLHRGNLGESFPDQFNKDPIDYLFNLRLWLAEQEIPDKEAKRIALTYLEAKLKDGIADSVELSILKKGDPDGNNVEIMQKYENTLFSVEYGIPAYVRSLETQAKDEQKTLKELLDDMGIGDLNIHFLTYLEALRGVDGNSYKAKVENYWQDNNRDVSALETNMIYVFGQFLDPWSGGIKRDSFPKQLLSDPLDFLFHLRLFISSQRVPSELENEQAAVLVYLDTSIKDGATELSKLSIHIFDLAVKYLQNNQYGTPAFINDLEARAMSQNKTFNQLLNEMGIGNLEVRFLVPQ